MSPLLSFPPCPRPASTSSCTSFATEVFLARRFAKLNFQRIRLFVLNYHAPHSESSEGPHSSFGT